MKVGLYARVSREEQAEGYSVDEQLEAKSTIGAGRNYRHG